MGISRNSMQKIYGIAGSSIERWEKGGTPSKKNYKKLLEAARSAGIECSQEWLEYGIGNTPKLYNKNSAPNEIKMIFNYLPNSRSYELHQVTDDAMSPKIKKGNWIIAEKIAITQAEKLHNKVCLIDIKDQKLVRTLKQASTPGLYDLITAKYIAGLPCMYNMELVAIARVIFIYYA